MLRPHPGKMTSSCKMDRVLPQEIQDAWLYFQTYALQNDRVAKGTLFRAIASLGALLLPTSEVSYSWQDQFGWRKAQDWRTSVLPELPLPKMFASVSKDFQSHYLQISARERVSAAQDWFAKLKGKLRGERRSSRRLSLLLLLLQQQSVGDPQATARAHQATMARRRVF